MMPESGLYVVATPIGNLEDISHRALRILAEVACIAAEDTRHSKVLLDHYGIGTPMLSLHEHNEQERIPSLIERVRAGEALALISDAGTPLISDPGFRLVRAMHDAGLPVYSVPGASAVTAALSIGGMASDRFLFEGFLPAKASARKNRLKSLATEPSTLVFFESSHRVQASVADMAQVFGADRKAAICRELTKRFETVLRGDLEKLAEVVAREADQRKGEFVILVAGNTEQESDVDGLELARALREHIPASQAARVAAKVTGASRRDHYKALEDS
jgi:16S rRNA (cytidine1402-2'-O)-methyltransferase